jgi:hypothetical protein
VGNQNTIVCVEHVLMFIKKWQPLIGNFHYNSTSIFENTERMLNHNTDAISFTISLTLPLTQPVLCDSVIFNCKKRKRATSFPYYCFRRKFIIYCYKAIGTLLVVLHPCQDNHNKFTYFRNLSISNTQVYGITFFNNTDFIFFWIKGPFTYFLTKRF